MLVASHPIAALCNHKHENNRQSNAGFGIEAPNLRYAALSCSYGTLAAKQ